MPGSWSDFLKLRSGPAPPPSSEAGAVRVYADADGALRSVQSDGTDAAIGGDALPDPFIVVGTDPNQETAQIKAPFGQTVPAIFELEIDDGAGGDHSLLTLGAPGTSGFQVAPNPDNNTAVQFFDSGRVEFADQDGDVSLGYVPETKYLDLDPQNGQVGILQAGGKGFLRLAASSEPADGDLAFNGCFIFYIDGNDLKAKAKIGGSFLHLTVGTFA